MNPRTHRLLLLVLFCNFHVVVLAQNPLRVIDSLQLKLKTAREDTSKVKCLNELAYQLNESNQADSSRVYADRALSLAEYLKYTDGIADANWHIGIIYYTLKKYELALPYLEKGYAMGKKCGNKIIVAKALNTMGSIDVEQYNLDAGILKFKEALLLSRQTTNLRLTGKLLRNLGTASYNNGDNPSAIQYFSEAIFIFDQLSFKSGSAYCHRQISGSFADQNNLDTAIQHIHFAIDLYEQLDDQYNLSNCYGVLGGFYFYLNQINKAEESVLKSISISEQIKDRDGVAWSKMSLGRIQEKRMAYDQAFESYDSAAAIFREETDSIGLASANDYLGALYITLGQYSKAKDYELQALHAFQSFGDLRSIAVCFSRLANIEDGLGNFQEAVSFNIKAKTFFEEAGLGLDLAYILMSLGNLSDKMGNLPEALQYFYQSLSFFTELGNKEYLVTIHTYLGELYTRLNQRDEAITHFTQALELIKESPQQSNWINLYLSLGQLFQNEKNWDEALSTYQKAADIAKSIEDQHMLAHCFSHLGSLSLKRNNYEDALAYYSQALEIHKLSDHKMGMGDELNALGKINTMLAIQFKDPPTSNRYLEALNRLEEALKLNQEINYKEGIRDAYQQFSETYSSMGNYEDALNYQSLYIALKDSLLNNETTRQLEQLRTQYEVEKAITSEKVKQDSLLAEQKLLSAKEQSEINARHELALVEAKAQKEKAIEVARIRYQMDLATAKTDQERQLAEQKYQSELRLAEENARHQIALADEKAKEEADKAARTRRNEFIVSAFALLGLISMFLYLLNRQRNLKRKAIEKAETMHKMAELELQSLRAQLNPHFMFNSLNAIQELILLEENEKSHTYLARFAKLLRMLLENANSPFIPLARELEFLGLYLSLENLRIPDLKYNLNLDPGIDPEQIQIPNMILQPYIENAIWHGLSHKPIGERKLQIRVLQQVDGVQYEIEDNGVGRKKAAELKSVYRKAHRSKGMELLTKRFKLLSEEYRFEIKTDTTDIMENDQVAGTLVTILIPWELAGDLKKLAS